MRSTLARFALSLVLAGCASGAPKAEPPPAPRAAPAPAVAVADVDAASPAAPADAGAPVAEVDASAAPPPAVERKGKVWPFHPWDRAVAVTFNDFPMRPRTQLRAYDEHGWSPHLTEKKPLDAAKAKKAVDLVTATNGDVFVSKCPFPRHAVVLYEGEVPVASINVCFECGDILLWPRWEPEPDWDRLSDREMKAIEDKRTRQMKLYDKAFPRWKTFFRDDVGFAVDDRGH
jgi:hypothetical protein